MTEKKRIRSSSDSIMKNNIFCVCQKGCKMRYQRLLSNYSKYVLFLFRHSLSSVFLRVFFIIDPIQTIHTQNIPRRLNQFTKYTCSHFILFQKTHTHFFNVQAFYFGLGFGSLYYLVRFVHRRIECLQQTFKLSFYKLIFGFVDSHQKISMIEIKIEAVFIPLGF